MPKTEADQLADHYRDAIRSGTFHKTVLAPGHDTTPVPDTRVTFGYVADRYLAEYVPFDHTHGGPRRPASRKLMTWYVGALRRAEIPAGDGLTVTLETKPIADVTKADVEAVRSGWKLRTTGSLGGQVGPNRGLKRLRHLFGWAIEQGYVEATPFRRGDKVVIHIPRDRTRTRRLEPGEEEKLLQAADPWLHALIVALLETGCRVGELLTLTWADVRRVQNVLLIRAEVAKDVEPRDVPMTSRVKSVLEMRRHAPDGREFPLTASVFGNAIGEPVTSHRRPWEDLCAAVKIEDLHIHDLRREFSCRLRESGAPDHIVAEWLGHANITTTSTYLKANRVSLQQYLKRFEQHRKICKPIVSAGARQSKKRSAQTALNSLN
jgi:integrase